MADDDGFLTAIRVNPTDDTLRLVYADWLEARGDPMSTAKADPSADDRSTGND
jgi:uncharacterized protein (TIGR02996 family)